MEKSDVIKLKVLANFLGAVAHVLWIVVLWTGMFIAAFIAAIFTSSKK